MPKTAGADASALDTCRQKAAGAVFPVESKRGCDGGFCRSAGRDRRGRAISQNAFAGGRHPAGAVCPGGCRLSPGQLSGILEAEEGYGILLRLPDDPQAVRQDFLDRQLQTEAETAPVEVTERYQALDTAAFCAELDQARAALRRTP